MDKVGFIGLGRMGRPMASNLRRKGFALTVTDINPQPVADLVALGATAAADLEELGRSSDILRTMLPSSPEVLAVVTGASGVLEHARAGQVLLDMSTIEPEATESMARAAAAKGGTVVGAAAGRLATH